MRRQSIGPIVAVAAALSLFLVRPVPVSTAHGPGYRPPHQFQVVEATIPEIQHAFADAPARREAADRELPEPDRRVRPQRSRT